MAATGFHYKRYFIVIDDVDRLIALQQANPDGVTISPDQAAITYSAPIWDGTGQKPAAPRIELGGLPANSILTTNVEEATYGAGNTIDGGGVMHALAGAPGGTLFWSGAFEFGGAPFGGSTNQGIMPQRFATGFEVPNTVGANPGVVGNTAFSSCRDASRTSDGMGFAYRNESGATTITGTLTPATYKNSWERFYIRPRTYSSGGTGQDSFWSAVGSAEGGGPALNMHLDSTGVLKLYNQGNAAFPGTLLGICRPAALRITSARLQRYR